MINGKPVERRGRKAKGSKDTKVYDSQLPNEELLSGVQNCILHVCVELVL
jgi:hypothetical protein